jgi:hypothetical protein
MFSLNDLPNEIEEDFRFAVFDNSDSSNKVRGAQPHPRIQDQFLELTCLAGLAGTGRRCLKLHVLQRAAARASPDGKRTLPRHSAPAHGTSTDAWTIG